MTKTNIIWTSEPSFMNHTTLSGYDNRLCWNLFFLLNTKHTLKEKHLTFNVSIYDQQDY